MYIKYRYIYIYVYIYILIYVSSNPPDPTGLHWSGSHRQAGGELPHDPSACTRPDPPAATPCQLGALDPISSNFPWVFAPICSWCLIGLCLTKLAMELPVCCITFLSFLTQQNKK